MLTFRLSKQGWAVIGILLTVFILYYFSDSNPIARLHGNVISVRTLLIHCVQLAEDAGQVIKDNRASAEMNVRLKTHEGGPKNEVVTDTDMKSHQTIVSGLKSAFDGLEVISEEHPPISSTSDMSLNPTSHSKLNNRLSDSDLYAPVSDLTVWVDPLDATQEFTEGLLDYVTVMICVALHGYPIIGVIHQPFLNRTYWAWRSHGISQDVVEALTEATKIRLPANRPLVVTYSRSHLKNATIQRLAEALKPQEVQFVPAGGSGFKTLSLLSGKAHVYIHPASTRRWDICAPKAVLEAVGGRMTGLDGSRLTFRSDDPPKIPQSVGLFAASSVPNYNRWREVMAGVDFTDKG